MLFNRLCEHREAAALDSAWRVLSTSFWFLRNNFTSEMWLLRPRARTIQRHHHCSSAASAPAPRTSVCRHSRTPSATAVKADMTLFMVRVQMLSCKKAGFLAISPQRTDVARWRVLRKPIHSASDLLIPLCLLLTRGNRCIHPHELGPEAAVIVIEPGTEPTAKSTRRFKLQFSCRCLPGRDLPCESRHWARSRTPSVSRASSSTVYPQDRQC